MLSADEIEAIERVLQHYEDRRAGAIDAMKVIQEHRGWVSDESLQALAAFLELSVDELEGLATFYNLIYRRPVGRHVVLLCDSVSCWIRGYEGIRLHLQQLLGRSLGETTEDGRFTLLPIPCLGACERAPAMMIDDDLHTELHVDGIARILERYQ